MEFTYDNASRPEAHFLVILALENYRAYATSGMLVSATQRSSYISFNSYHISFYSALRFKPLLPIKHQ
jgi:hypothetical protein